MSADRTIRKLLAGGRRARIKPDKLGLERQAARAAWAHETATAWRAAQQRLDDAWDRIFSALPDDITDEEFEALNIPDPPEQAEVDRLHAMIWAVIDHDKWPRELYWGGV